MPYVFEHLDRIKELLRQPPFGLITDADGTISPIAPTPEQAKVFQLCRRYLTRLYHRVALVALISGRSAAAVREMVGLEGPVYIGNHGLERWQNGRAVLAPLASDYQALITSVVETLARNLQIDGLKFEDKGLSASVHYRLALEPEAAKTAILDALGNIPGGQELRILAGKKVIDILPPLAADKGTAVTELVRDYHLRSGIYLGDDTTDIDAFRAIHQLSGTGDFRGLAIGVVHAEMPPNLVAEADFTLNGVPDVERFLNWLSQAAAG
jgi:trehalose 6-phosphate phosphatase